jgi:hypothetical protein
VACFVAYGLDFAGSTKTPKTACFAISRVFGPDPYILVDPNKMQVAELKAFMAQP